MPNALRDRDGFDPNNHGLDAELGAIETDLSGYHDELQRLLDTLEEEVDLTVQREVRGRIRQRAQERNELKARLAVLLERREQTAGAVVQRRVDKVIAALQVPEGGDLDRAAANVALRTIFDRAVINYPEGTIDLRWKAGGTLRVHYAMRSLKRTGRATM